MRFWKQQLQLFLRGAEVTYHCRAVRASRVVESSTEAANLQLSNSEVTEAATAIVMTPPHSPLGDLGPAHSETPLCWQPHSKPGLKLINGHLKGSPQDPQNAWGREICKALIFPYKRMKTGSQRKSSININRSVFVASIHETTFVLTSW